MAVLHRFYCNFLFTHKIYGVQANIRCDLHVSSPAFPIGVVHVLLHVAVTPNIDLDAIKYKDHWILLILVLHIFRLVVLL